MKITDEMIKIALERYKRPVHMESHFVAMKAAVEAILPMLEQQLDHIADINKMVEPEENQDGWIQHDGKDIDFKGNPRIEIKRRGGLWNVGYANDDKACSVASGEKINLWIHANNDYQKLKNIGIPAMTASQYYSWLEQSYEIIAYRIISEEKEELAAPKTCDYCQQSYSDQEVHLCVKRAQDEEDKAREAYKKIFQGGLKPTKRKQTLLEFRKKYSEKRYDGTPFNAEDYFMVTSQYLEQRD